MTVENPEATSIDIPVHPSFQMFDDAEYVVAMCCKASPVRGWNETHCCGRTDDDS